HLLRYTLGLNRLKLPAPQVLIRQGLGDPQNVTLDSAGNFYISDDGNSNQVKVFTAQGKFLRAIGEAGRPKLGVYDPHQMHQPHGVTIDSLNRLWVAETDFVPKRVSIWNTRTGNLLQAFYGPMEYGGGGALDPADKTRFYYSGLEFALNWQDGSNKPVANYYQASADTLKLPADFKSRAPETAIRYGGREYLTDCYSVSPTNAAGSAALWRLQNGVARPVAALGDANSWPLLAGLFRGTGSYSVRWTGQVQAPVSETYTFSTISDDGARLWVNGRQIIDDWAGHGTTEDTGTIALQAGKRYDIRLEYCQSAGGATMHLSWVSPHQPKQIIPASCLYPTAQAAKPGGLTGQYYNGTDLKDLQATQIDPMVDFDWNAAPPAALTKSGAAFQSRLPADVKRGDHAAFVWSDENGDGKVEPNEVTLVKGEMSGITVMPDLSFVAAYWDGRAVQFSPMGVTAQGVPHYDLARGKVLAEGTRTPRTSGGGQALAGTDGWTVLTVPPTPYDAQGSMAGVKNGVPTWTYPSLWPGLHPSHDAPMPDHPGELIGTTRLLGGLVTPHGSDAGPIWAINGNKGNVYLFTQDGLFVATLFQDSRLKGWDAPKAIRGMSVNDLSLQEENFWPSLTQTEDGHVYLVGGGDGGNIIRVDGLDGIQRLPAVTVTVTPALLGEAQAYFVATEAARQASEAAKQMPLTVALRSNAPTVDGKLDEWPKDAFVPIDAKTSAALAVSGDRLYAAFRTGDDRLLDNAGGSLPLLFKTGGALDIQLDAVSGGERLLVTQVKGKPTAVLYRPHVPGTTSEPIAFSSPQRTLRFDRVDDVSSQVTLAGRDGNYELSVPLSVLGLTATAGQTLHGDLGILRGNGFQTLQRIYWHNKATGLVSDIPSEAELTPQLWGTWMFK
ncbi:MAG: PA14 domain-containing protein, partial [Armatimonadota bacterium]|nr:PA14 domain-containing protein [Armatimonadota bacterium]